MSGGPVNQSSGSRPTNQPRVVLETCFMITRLHHPGTDASRDGRHLGLAGVLRAGPEEAPQAVLAPPGHDVDMEMGHALAHDVVLGHEVRRDLARDDLAELAAGGHSGGVYGRSRGLAASRLGTITLRRK